MGKVKLDLHASWKKLCVSAILIILGSALILFWPAFWKHVLFQQWELRPGTVIHKFWNEPPQPLYMDIYFFNWTNPQEFTNKSIKPNFVEIGPYRFQEFPQKVNVTFNDQNATVSYRKQSRYIFMPHQSRGQLSDVITSVNVVALSAANQARSWNILKVKGVELSLAFFDQQIHLTKTAAELLFEGYDDPIISVAKEIAKVMGLDVPFDRFGWFYKRNESSLLTGSFNSDTTVAKLGQIREWNYKSKTNFFEGDCANINGASAGELFPPQSSKGNILSVFSPEMCRNVVMDFETESNVHGIMGRKFSGGDRTIDNGTKYPENKCFCAGECVPSGVLNVTSCRLGAPVFMSFPHFYAADPYYLNQIDGMKPDKQKHQFFMTFEPKTSLPLAVAGRFQLNVLIQPIKNINMYKNVPKKFLPVVWFEQSFEISNCHAFMIQLILAVPYFGQFLGFLIAIFGMYLIFKVISQKRHDLSLRNESQHDSTTKRLPEISPLIN